MSNGSREEVKLRCGGDTAKSKPVCSRGPQKALELDGPGAQNM